MTAIPHRVSVEQGVLLHSVLQVDRPGHMTRMPPPFDLLYKLVVWQIPDRAQLVGVQDRQIGITGGSRTERAVRAVFEMEPAEDEQIESRIDDVLGRCPMEVEDAGLHAAERKGLDEVGAGTVDDPVGDDFYRDVFVFRLRLGRAGDDNSRRQRQDRRR